MNDHITEEALPDAKLIVTTTVPGRRRAGAVFTGANQFALDHFTRAQLEEILTDNVLTVSIGRIVKLSDVDAYLAKVQAHNDSIAAHRALFPIVGDEEIQSGAAAAARADTGATSDERGGLLAETGPKVADGNASSLVNEAAGATISGVSTRAGLGGLTETTVHTGTGKGRGRI